MLDIYADRKKWPARRYRLDGTPMGNSRLLMKSQMEQHPLMGGKMVDYVELAKVVLKEKESREAHHA